MAELSVAFHFVFNHFVEFFTAILLYWEQTLGLCFLSKKWFCPPSLHPPAYKSGGWLMNFLFCFVLFWKQNASDNWQPISSHASQMVSLKSKLIHIYRMDTRDDWQLNSWIDTTNDLCLQSNIMLRDCSVCVIHLYTNHLYLLRLLNWSIKEHE